MNKEKIDTTKFYNDLSQNWDNTRPKYTQEIFRKIASRLDKNKSCSILDFGCGTGLFCKYLSENLPKAKIDGIDISNQMIEKARINCPNSNFYTGDIFSVTLPQYDVIVSKDVFNHIDDIPKTLKRLDSLLRVNGMLILANREREQGVKNNIVTTFESLEYKTFVEQYSFMPTREEIELFLKTLPNFSEHHIKTIRERLEASGEYYVVYATKKIR
ncbi:Trans-aconitate 2-methyltransferase [uncultured archaeon]|nr:Trans-aconitate 2-methyltransferase [uncultured archaeon]